MMNLRNPTVPGPQDYTHSCPIHGTLLDDRIVCDKCNPDNCTGDEETCEVPFCPFHKGENDPEVQKAMIEADNRRARQRFRSRT
jgi:hypothetical protein